MRIGLTGTAAQLVLAATLSVALAGCLDANVPSAAPTVRITPEPTPVTTVYELGSKVWYEGLVLTIDRVTATLDERGGLVNVLILFENPGSDATELSGKVALHVGEVRVEPTRDSKIPEVPGQGSVAALLTFELQAIPSVNDATIEIGTSPLHVAKVPVTAAAGVIVAFEPVALALTGTATASGLKITLHAGEVRWDLPDWWEELDAGLETLTLTYDATYVGDFAGGLAFTGDNVALRLPDGTEVDPRHDGHSQSVELIGAHKTKRALFSRFEIPAGLKGKFALLVRNAGTTKAIPFVIGN